MESSNRLFRKFPTPAWMNNANVRTAGVYLSGALVGHSHPAAWRFRKDQRSLLLYTTPYDLSTDTNQR